MSLTLITRRLGKPSSRVTVGGELDKHGVRGYVLLFVTPHRALLTPATARRLARTLLQFAARATR